MELRAGVRLDRYTLVLSLGEGGQAAVWKAIDPLEGGSVRALKVFRLAGANPQVAERARREAKASARARHPGLLPCRTLFEDPTEELIALVFDYVRGRSLAEAISDPRMTAEHRRCAVRQIADVLAYVHEQDVIHRDIKPDNVLVTDAFWESPSEPGTLKLVDFGIAAEAGNPRPLTREGGVVGTTAYLPPELLNTAGLFGVGTDFQRDVFAFGVLAWEVLVGKHPTGLALDASREAFAGVYLAARAGKRRWPPEQGVSKEVQVAAACLSLAPRERPPTVREVAYALRTGDLQGMRPHRGGSSGPGPITITHDPPPSAGLPADSGRSSTEPMQVSMPVPSVDRVVLNSQSQSRVSLSPSISARPPERGSTTGGATRAQKRKRTWLTPVLLGASLCAIAAVGTSFYFRSTKSAEEQPPVTLGSPPKPSIPVPTATPTSASKSTPEPENPVPRDLDICCGASASKCDSGRPCRPGTCSTHVNDRLSFRLRVGGATYFDGKKPDDVQIKWPSSTICLKNLRTGEESCASSATILRKLSDPVHRILATPEDLQQHRIEVRVLDGSTLLVHEIGHGYPLGYSTRDLCGSVSLRLRDYDKPIGRVYLYLDDP